MKSEPINVPLEMEYELQFTRLMHQIAAEVDNNPVDSGYQFLVAVVNAVNELGPDHLFYAVAHQLFNSEEKHLERSMNI